MGNDGKIKPRSETKRLEHEREGLSCLYDVLLGEGCLPIDSGDYYQVSVDHGRTMFGLRTWLKQISNEGMAV